MAQKYLVELVDDLDDTPAETTITFGIDGKNYAIDLNMQHADQLHAVLEPYVAAARKADSAPFKRKTSSAGTRTDLAAIREWANNNGYTVAERGRIAHDIQTAYDAAH